MTDQPKIAHTCKIYYGLPFGKAAQPQTKNIEPETANKSSQVLLNQPPVHSGIYANPMAFDHTFYGLTATQRQATAKEENPTPLITNNSSSPVIPEHLQAGHGQDDPKDFMAGQPHPPFYQ